MSIPFYASAEQIMRDRSEYARKGIARGRSVVVLHYSDGVLFVAENTSPALHKVSEIYDRIGFAAVGKYNEFENLRVAGIRLADLRGYSYDRRDVTARALANAYAQTLGAIFTEQQKPYEVELCVAEVGAEAAQDQLYRLSYDGTIVDEPNFLVMGGQADAVAGQVRDAYRPGLPLAEAMAVAVRALGSVGGENGSQRNLAADGLEVAVLDRNRAKRKFRRITGAALASMLPGGGSADTASEPVTEPADTASEPVTEPADASSEPVAEPGGVAEPGAEPVPGADEAGPAAQGSGDERLPDTD
jgi:proteasome alpha subunit